MMDCKEFQKYISSLVDDQIDEQKRTEAEEHLNKCPSCYFDYKIESLVKKIVSLRFHKSTCPEVIKNQIIFKLAKKTNFSTSLVEQLRSLIKSKIIRLSFAFGVLIIFSIFYFDLFKSNNENYYQRFASVVYQNCQELRKHNFPEKSIFSSNPEIVMNFISANGISKPVMPKTDWLVLAAGIESYNDYHAAHILFKCEDDTVYMMECEIDRLKHSGYLEFFDKIHQDLKKKKFVKVGYNNCLIVFRLEENVLTAFAMNSENPFEELIASLE